MPRKLPILKHQSSEAGNLDVIAVDDTSWFAAFAKFHLVQFHEM
jgi:hypothetical protein